MRLSISRILLVALALPAACATAFTGAPHYPGGPSACHSNCARQNMEMSSFIYSGEFASSCVCRPRAAPTAPPPAPTPQPPAAGGNQSNQPDVDDAAAVGVVLQQRRAAAQQQSTSQR